MAPQEALQNIDEHCVFVGSGAVLYRGVIADKLDDLACFATREQHIIQAATLANLACKRFEKGDAGEVDDLVPRYIRKSDAELNFSRKDTGTKRKIK
jgi:tRNA threonylcarbamoyladenosine biosynthesis protein TsaB